MSQASDESHARHRNRSIRLAVLTSLLSKGGTVLLQLLSIPIAVRVLGRDEFGLYTMVNLTLSMVSLLQVGVGPALTHGLAKARAAGRDEEQKILGSTAFFLMAGICACVGLLLAAAFSCVPLDAIYGDAFAGRGDVMRPALWTGLGLFLLLFVLNLTERVREGHLEVASNNVWGAVGNVLAALVVGFGVWWVPQIWFLVLAMHGSMVVAKLCNTVGLWRAHPLMIPSIRSFRPQVARRLFTDGLAFSTCCLVTGIVEYNICGWMAGRVGGPSEVALYGVFISMTVMQLGFVVMFSTPTWPAVAEALARGDRPWARKAAARLYLFGSGFAVCSALGLVLVGPWLLPLWLGGEFAGVSRGVLACYGLYFIAHVWRHLNHTMMIGTGQVAKMVPVQLLESALVAIAAWIALRQGGIGAQLASMGMVILLLTGTVLPIWVFRSIGRPKPVDSSP